MYCNHESRRAPFKLVRVRNGNRFEDEWVRCG